MSKITWVLTASAAVVALGAGAYFYSTRYEVSRIEEEVARPPVASIDKPSPPPTPKPDHGHFEKRFEPKPPPTNGGKLN